MALPRDVFFLLRDFDNNSFAYLFGELGNAAELIQWLQPTIIAHLDLSRLKVESVKFIAPSFQQLECDVLLSAPWHETSAVQNPPGIFILIEHQSEPDVHMTYRVLRYVMLVLDRQEQSWRKRHSTTRHLVFHPVLPIVLYVGTRTWGQLQPIRDVVQHRDLFGTMLPELAPLFVNLTETDPAVLQQVGVIGWMLWLIQQKRRPLEEFEVILQRVVTEAERLPVREKERWKKLLWFARGLVYHDREEPEWDRLVEIILASARLQRRAEVEHMGRDIFEALRQEGVVKGKAESKIETKQEMLVRQIRLRFKRVPSAIRAEIQATQDNKKLDEWIEAFATAEKITDIPFQANVTK